MRHGLLRFGHQTRKPKGVEDLALDGLPHALHDPLPPANLLRIKGGAIQYRKLAKKVSGPPLRL